MFNQKNQDELDQERAEGEGLFAATPEEWHQPQTEEQTTESHNDDGEVKVQYVGAGGKYTDNDGTVYKKRQPVAVSANKADELTSLRGGTLFVRTDS